MAPLVGTAHLAYIPKDRVVGLSKLESCGGIFKKITNSRKINDANCTIFNDIFRCKGVAVTIDAAHQCMTMRGIKKRTLLQ